MDLKNVPKNRIIFIGVIVGLLVLGGVLISVYSRPNPQANAINLNFWGTDPREYWQGVFAAYKAARPEVNIAYSQINAASYEKDLVTAFATGKGPDIFMIGNRDLMSRLPLLASSTRVLPAELAAVFPPAVADSFVHQGKVYALPLYLDTLALYYDRTKFDQAGLATPPATWEELIAAVPRLRKVNVQGQITEAAIAIGGSEKTVVNAADILYLLMLQNGARIADEKGEAVFSGPKGVAAFQFYFDFADAGSAAYTWNEGMQKSTEAFTTGKAASILMYQSDAKQVLSKSPFLSPGVAPVPQIGTTGGINIARSQGLAAWIGSRKNAEAWNFILFAGTNVNAARTYMEASGRPPALRALIAEAGKRADLSVFAKQALTARSWLSPDYATVRSIVNEVMQSYFRGELNAAKAVDEMENRINQIRP